MALISRLIPVSGGDDFDFAPTPISQHCRWSRPCDIDRRVLMLFMHHAKGQNDSSHLFYSTFGSVLRYSG